MTERSMSPITLTTPCKSSISISARSCERFRLAKPLPSYLVPVITEAARAHLGLQRLHALLDIEQRWIAPALAALKSGQLGGYGAMWRTVVGWAFIAAIGNSFNILSVNSNYQSLVKGLVLIGALAIDVYVRRLARSGST